MGLPIWGKSLSAETKTVIKEDPTTASRSAIRRNRLSSRFPNPPLRRATALERIANTDISITLGDDGPHPSTRNPGRDPRRSPASHGQEPRRTSLTTLGNLQARRRASPSPRPPVPEPHNYMRSPSPMRTRSPHLRSRNRRNAQEYLDEAILQEELRAANDVVSRIALPAYTPEFAPAQSAARAEGPHRRNIETRFGRIDEREDNHRNFESAMMSMRHSAGGLHQRYGATDGLGDRQRSTTPEGFGDAAWETMLETMRPDEQLPSAESSFTTAAAAASFSTSGPTTRSGSTNSAGSARTHITVPTSLDGVSMFDVVPCDSAESSTTSAASDSEPEETHQSSRPNRQPTRIRHHTSDNRRRLLQDVEPTEEHTSTTPGSHLLQLLRRRSAARTMRDRHSTLPLGEPDLEDLRPVLERYARRDDIPVEWWQSVGLTPVVAQAVNRDIPPTGHYD